LPLLRQNRSILRQRRHSPASRQFRAGESFRENIAPDAEVRILWIGASFMHRYAAKTECRRSRGGFTC
jgi:hypothetical protein